MNKSCITVENISKNFGDFQALDAIECHAPAHSITGLIGLNGAGKTTLLKIMLGLLHACSGHVELMGKPSSQASSRQSLYYMPEKLSPSSYLTGLEFLSLTLQAYQQPFDRAKAETLATELNMPSGCLSRRIKTYSKGMAQKLGLLAGLLSNRQLWILDEPMSGLDPEARYILKQQLLSLKENGASVLFSSHILSDIASLCDWLLVMHQGTLIYQGNVKGFIQKKADLEQAFLSAIAA